MYAKRASILTLVDRMRDFSPAGLIELYQEYDPDFLERFHKRFSEDSLGNRYPEDASPNLATMLPVEQLSMLLPFAKEALRRLYEHKTLTPHQAARLKNFRIERRCLGLSFATEGDPLIHSLSASLKWLFLDLRMMALKYDEPGVLNISWADFCKSQNIRKESAQKNYAEVLCRRRLIEIHNEGEENEEVSIAPWTLVYFDLAESTIFDFLIVQLIRELNEAVSKADMLSVCQECKSIFLREARAPRAVFCSDKCAGRVHQRRYAKRKKEENSLADSDEGRTVLSLIG